MADIRSFFTSKGGAANKPAPAKSAERPKTQRSKGRKIVEDSDDDDPIEQAKPPSKPTVKKRKTPLETKGVEISADDYFVSTAQASKSKPTQSATSEKGADITNEGPVRSSPRGKKAVFTSTSATFRNYATAEKRSTANELHHVHDNDASMETAEEYGEETHESKMKGRNKREKDDYIEEEPREGAQIKSKRVATRGRPPSGDTGTNTPQKKAKTAVAGRKRRSASLDSHSEDKPRKRQLTPRKVQTPSAKKKTESEESEIQKIFDSVATIRAPTPPPKDANSKFDWRKAAAGGGNASAQPTQAAALPEGQEECLSGLSFVFTGILQQIGREEAQALVKRYGGKVTGQPSSKTSFVVLGEDAGPSKLAKIKAHGLRTIDENGLFDLIRNLPAFGGSGAGAQKAQEKKKAEEEKVKKQVAEMEAEERAIKAEETKAAQRAAATSRGRSVAAAPAAAQKNGQLLTSKYAPTQMSHICGNKAQVERIQSWLRNWPKSKKHNFQRRGADGLGGERALIISGPPGIGKTTAAHLAAKLEGYDVLESNASDTRSKRLVEAGLSEVMKNTSLLGYFAGDGKTVDASKKKLVLIMDEVDGMSAGDRGGVGALVQFCRKTWVPLILICNERRLPKMKPFDHVAFNVRFNRPTVEQVRSRIMTICHREGLRLPPPVVDALIEGSNKDIRQIINMISTAKFDQTSMNFDEGKAMSKAWEKHVVLKSWDICQKMLGGGLFMPTSKATLNDKIELYFNDHEFSFLMIQENYLRTKPLALKSQGYTKREEQVKALELFDRAAESISDGDLVDRMIHGPQQHWSLMPTHAVFSTVRPASFIAGQLVGSNFTSWLGNFSKSGKLGRYVRQMHSHMRLRSSGDHNEIRQQYLPVLWERMVNRLQNEGVDAVTDVIQLMDSYFLTRDDFDAIKELGIGPMAEEQVTIETKTKAAFTRIYNLMVHPVPFMKASNVLAPKKLTKEAPDLEEAIEEDEAELVEAAEVEDDEVDVSKDKYIKQPKPKKTGKKSGKATVADREDDKPKRRGKTNKGTK